VSISSESHLPKLGQINSLLALREGNANPAWFQSSLLEPLASVLHRPSKQVRARLVFAGHALGTAISNEEGSPSAALKFSQMLEEMHCGSLIIDDIQDGSEERRGSPSLHISHGMPVALNAGNWLYFWQLYQMRELGLSAAQELELTRLCISTYLQGHFGQALDVGLRAEDLPRAEITDASRTNMELKTGSLLSFALGGGALIGGASLAQIAPLISYGRALGSYLQMFDDIGNVSNASLGPKRYEDLRSHRLAWVWAIAADSCPSSYQNFLLAIEREEFEEAHRILENAGVLSEARCRAKKILKEAKQTFEEHLPSDLKSVLQEINAIEKLLTDVYEKT
jgi:geranylgeranyl pyrophosphate synthase